MSEIDLYIGDLVRVQGSVAEPTLTVSGAGPGGIECIWFSGSDLKRECFHPTLLMKIQEARGPKVGSIKYRQV